MGLNTFAAVLWRRRALLALAFVLAVAAVVAVTLSLPKSYKATATLFVGTERAIDATQAYDTTLGEQLVRTYTTLAANPNVADDVARRLGGRVSREALLAKMSFAPIERTRLLEIAAVGDSAASAQALANTYAIVFVARANAQVDRDQAPARLAVNEPAAVPTGAFKPNPPLYIGLGVILSAFLAAGAALLRDRLDDRMTITRDEQDVLGARVVARVPDVARRQMSSSREFRDAFSILKTNLDFLGDVRPRVLLVTSPAPEDGKSTVSWNLALAALSDGERVALVETDLRRPGLAGVLDGSVERERGPGLSEYLLARAERRDVAGTDSRWPGLTLIWGGAPAANPSTLLHSTRFADLVKHLAETHDRVILDAPPISIGADASVAVRVVDAALFVLSAEHSRRSIAQSGLNQLLVARAPLIGVVLNRAKLGRSTSYSYYYDDAIDVSAPELAHATLGRGLRTEA